MKKKLELLFVLIWMAIFMVGCKENVSGMDKDNVNITPVVVDDDTDGESSFFSTDEELFEIETPYCNLYYPLMWKDQIVIEFEEKDVYTVKFAAKTDSEIIPLFDLCFDGKNGEKIGELALEDKDIDVNIISYGFELDGCSDDMQSDICGMNEDVNVIVSKLLEMYDFTLANVE